MKRDAKTAAFTKAFLYNYWTFLCHWSLQVNAVILTTHASQLAGVRKGGRSSFIYNSLLNARQIGCADTGCIYEYDNSFNQEVFGELQQSQQGDSKKHPCSTKVDSLHSYQGLG